MIPVPVTDDGEIDLQALDALLDERVKMVAVNHVSNALGTINPVQEIAAKAHAVGLLYGGRRSGHRPLVAGCAATGLRLFLFRTQAVGPTGIGVLWGREALLKPCRPFWAEGR